MLTLQAEYITMLGAFTRLFSKRIWEHAKILITGSILCPAERTVAAVLRVMGLSHREGDTLYATLFSNILVSCQHPKNTGNSLPSPRSSLHSRLLSPIIWIKSS